MISIARACTPLARGNTDPPARFSTRSDSTPCRDSSNDAESPAGGKAKILQAIAWGAVATLDVNRSHEEAVAQPDPGQGLRRAANIQRRQFELMYDVIAIYQEAARTDPDIAQDTRRISANRERAFRRHVESIAEHLAPGVTVDDGTDRYLALVLPEIYRTLVLERHWSANRYETWLGDALIHQLLATGKR